MRPSIVGGGESSYDESALASRLAPILGIDHEKWRIQFGAVIRGKSGVMHTFDAVLESRTDDRIATVLFLKETDENKSEKLMYHRVKSDDVSAYANYVILDHDLDARTDTIKEMCQLKEFKVNPSDLDAYRYTSMVRVQENEMKENRQPVSVTVPHNRQPARRNRDRTKIVHEILGSVIYLKSASITQLIYRCNLNYKYAKSLLSSMVGKDLLQMAELDGIGKRFEITSKGLKTFERLEFHEYI